MSILADLRTGLKTRAFVFLAILGALGCARDAAVPPEDLVAVEHPDLGAIEDVARRQLERLRSTLESKQAEGVDRVELAGAFGDMGEHYHSYELLEAAAACYRNAEKLDPDSFLWSYYLGAAQQKAGDLEAAADSLERALPKRPEDLPALRRLGEVRLALGDAAAARERFQALLADDRFAAAAHFGIGRAAAAAGEHSEAAEHFERVLELQPAAGIVHYPLGLALRGLGRDDDARRHLEEKASGEVSSPDRLMERLESLAVSAGAHLKRGNRALMSGRLDDASAAFRQAIEADPKASAARRNLALVLARQGDADGAVEELRAAEEVDPDNVWVHVDLGNAYLGKGLGEQAVDSLRRAVEIDPALVAARFNLANALIALDRWDEARPHLQELMRLDPAHDRAHYQLAMASHKAGDSATAVRELRVLLEKDPAFTVARLGLATVLIESRRAAEAMAVYRQGLALDLPASDQISLLQPLARLAWQQGQRQPAIGYWQRVTTLAPDSSQAWTDLANALQFSGQRQEARKLFGRAAELDPANATAWLSEASLWILDKEFAAARDRLQTAITHTPDHAGLNDTLARVLATSPSAEVRDGRRAMALARKAYALESKIEHAETFGMALAEAGRFEEAIRWQRSVINEAARLDDQKILPRLVKNLRLYENRQPVRISAD